MNNKTQNITLLGILTSIIIIMTAVPGIGFIPIGLVNATIIHVPVIILAIVKGPKMGAIIGLIFGLSSMANAFLRPTPASFLFMNPIIAIGPRVLIGVFSGYSFIFIKKLLKNDSISAGLAAGIGSMTNTAGVLGLIYIIYAQRYLEVTNRAGQNAFNVLLGIAGGQGIIEMLVCIAIVIPVATILLKLDKRGIL